MIVTVLTALAVFFSLQLVYLILVMRWCDAATRAGKHYGLPPHGRRRFRRLLRLHAFLLSPILRLLSLCNRQPFSQRGFRYRGIAGPLGACSEASFQAAEAYEPEEGDVFVVTQMRSGTTWMQHLVYQVLTRGSGQLPTDGQALNAVSPWLESRFTVPVAEAPPVGRDRPSRIIKTHLPRTLCPVNGRAKYIYVVRHPVSCFASCVDFVCNNLRGFAPSLEELESWYCSDTWMWWNSWPTHVRGWWEAAATGDNVLLVRYEDMVGDLERVARQVAAFLELEPLSSDELRQITRQCSFAYMREHADTFEMYPPHLLQAANAFFVSGHRNRHADVPAALRERIKSWCHQQCTEAGFPVEALYPELSGAKLASDGRAPVESAETARG